MMRFALNNGRQRVVRTSERSKIRIRRRTSSRFGSAPTFFARLKRSAGHWNERNRRFALRRACAEGDLRSNFFENTDRARPRTRPSMLSPNATQRIARGRFARFRIASGVRRTKSGSYPKYFFDRCGAPGLDIASVETAVIETRIVARICEKQFRSTRR